MTRGVVVATEGFVEEQLTYAFHRLREDGMPVAFATPSSQPVRGERGLVVEDTRSPQGDGPDEDIVVVPASDDIAVTLAGDLHGWLDARLATAAVFGCLGGGVRVLDHLDALDGRLVTGPEELREAVVRAGGAFTGERVTVDGTIVTGRDAASLPFFMAAVRNTQAIPQDPDRVVSRRPYQERAAWGAEGTE